MKVAILEEPWIWRWLTFPAKADWCLSVSDASPVFNNLFVINLEEDVSSNLILIVCWASCSSSNIRKFKVRKSFVYVLTSKISKKIQFQIVSEFFYKITMDRSKIKSYCQFCLIEADDHRPSIPINTELKRKFHSLTQKRVKFIL